MKNNKPNYKGQLLYIGIDVHLRRWIITIIFMGIKLETFSMDSDSDQLIKHLRIKYPGAKYQCVYEAGFSGFWLKRRLEAAGIDCKVVNPADIPTRHKERNRKTDKVDSLKLARELSTDSLEGIYIPSQEQESLRALCRLRWQQTRDQTRIKNRIKSLLNFLGIPIPENQEIKHWSNRFIRHISELDIPFAAIRLTLEGLLDQLRFQREQLTKTIKSLRKMIYTEEESKRTMKHLLSVPGIGFITAVTFYTEIMDINRFKKLEHLSAYVGFAPSTDNSGPKEKILGISSRQNKILRSMMIESAWVAIRKDTALTVKYGELALRMSSQESIVRIAKKLLNRMMYVWKKDRDYVLSVVN